MSTSLGGLGVELKRVAVIIAVDFAPMVERAATKLLAFLQAAEGIIKATDWLKLFFTLAGGPAMGIAINAWEMFAKVLEKVGIKAGQATDQIRDATREFGRFKTDNPESMGDRFRGLAGAVDAAVAYVPKRSGTKPRDRSGDVEISFAEEDEALAVEREQLKVAGQSLFEHQRAQDVLVKIGANQEATTAAVKSASGGMIMGLVKGAVELATNMGDKLQEGKAWLMGLLPGIGEGIEKALTKVLPTLLSKLPKLIAGALNLPFVILRAVVNAIPAMIQGIAAAFLKAITRLLEFFKGGSDKNILTGDKEKWLGTSFKKGEFSLLGFFNNDDRGDDTQQSRRARNNRNRARDIGSRMTGGYIDRTGSYLLHAGERVTPPTGSSTSAAMSAMRGGGRQGGGTVNIGTVIGMDVRELVRLIRRELDSYGSGASLTPRGA